MSRDDYLFCSYTVWLKIFIVENFRINPESYKTKFSELYFRKVSIS